MVLWMQGWCRILLAPPPVARRRLRSVTGGWLGPNKPNKKSLGMPPSSAVVAAEQMHQPESPMLSQLRAEMPANAFTDPGTRKRVAFLEAVKRDQFNVVWAELERAQHAAVSQAKEIEALNARVVSMEKNLDHAWAPLAAGNFRQGLSQSHAVRARRRDQTSRTGRELRQPGGRNLQDTGGCQPPEYRRSRRRVFHGAPAPSAHLESGDGILSAHNAQCALRPAKMGHVNEVVTCTEQVQ